MQAGGEARRSRPMSRRTVPSVRAVNPLIPAELDAICGRRCRPVRRTDTRRRGRWPTRSTHGWDAGGKIDIRLIAGAIAVVLLAIGGIAAAFLPRLAGRTARRCVASRAAAADRRPVDTKTPSSRAASEQRRIDQLSADTLVTSSNKKSRYHCRVLSADREHR